ncbi:MAG: aldehyde dehydrogenase family protein [Bdellovibrionaceae bacterium]|nr:aldehyde dehydrogenase family protein [Pseudobdellovibrionaceae bacterium]|tara:strand:+ start:51620 stop:52993 length:1374 start_codon:yes stop_codon:yes gene_type:complete
MIQEIHQKQSQYQQEIFPMTTKRRKLLLKTLASQIERHRKNIQSALRLDLGKSTYEADIAEIDYCLQDIKHTLKSIDSWAKPQKVKTPILVQPGTSYVHAEPLGKVLVIAPWNYPFQLLIAPLISALAAGNSVCLKPSEVSHHTAIAIENMIKEAFKPEEVAVVQGGVEETTELLNLNWDHIFYTGNSHVAKIVMTAAAKHLSPVTLELGGKSPCFVFDIDASLTKAARRIVWGKFFNTGQTCVAPDYILCQEKDKDKLVSLLWEQITNFYGNEIKESPDYGRIINAKHFDRLSKLINKDEILKGGNTDRDSLFIEPCILECTADSPAMQEEIFGPILPIIVVKDKQQAIEFVKKGDKPLAAYIFTDSNSTEKLFRNKISSGGMTTNDCLVHLMNQDLPFGGVGVSGMGSYHGKFGFDRLSHQKAYLKRSFFMDIDLRYPPYEGKLAKLKKIMSLIP